jgi:beta-lactam-binding protein with PASTA domain
MAITRKQWLIHLSLMGLTGAAFFMFFFFIWLPFTTHHGESIVVPELVGRPWQEAAELLYDAGLDYVVSDSNYIASKRGGLVLSQYPKSGSEVKPGRKLLLVVASEVPPGVAMPKLIGLSLRSAQNQLESAGLVLEKTETREAESEFVLEQRWEGKPVDAASPVYKGARITLVVGDGKKTDPVLIPELVGKSRAEAVSLVNSLGLQPMVLERYGRFEALGTVVEQKPAFAKGKSIKPGQMVRIWISALRPPPVDTVAVPADSSQFP